MQLVSGLKYQFRSYLFIASTPVDFRCRIAGSFTSQSCHTSLLCWNSRLTINNLWSSSSSSWWTSGDWWQIRIHCRWPNGHAGTSASVETAFVVSLAIGVGTTIFLAIGSASLSALHHRAATLFCNWSTGGLNARNGVTRRTAFFTHKFSLALSSIWTRVTAARLVTATLVTARICHEPFIKLEIQLNQLKSINLSIFFTFRCRKRS